MAQPCTDVQQWERAPSTLQLTLSRCSVPALTRRSGTARTTPRLQERLPREVVQ